MRETVRALLRGLAEYLAAGFIGLGIFTSLHILQFSVPGFPSWFAALLGGAFAGFFAGLEARGAWRMGLFVGLVGGLAGFMLFAYANAHPDPTPTLLIDWGVKSGTAWLVGSLVTGAIGGKAKIRLPLLPLWRSLLLFVFLPGLVVLLVWVIFGLFLRR